MARYIVSRKTRSDWLDENNPLLPNLSVCEHILTETGLLDEHSKPIMRMPRPVGFGRDKEW